MNSLNKALVELDNVKAQLDKIISNVKDATSLVERFDDESESEIEAESDKGVEDDEFSEPGDETDPVDAVGDNASITYGGVEAPNPRSAQEPSWAPKKPMPPLQKRSAQEPSWAPKKPMPPLQKRNGQSSFTPKIDNPNPNPNRDKSSIIPLLVEEDPQNNQDKSDVTHRDAFANRDEMIQFKNSGGTTSKKTVKKKKSKNTAPKRLTLNKKKSSDYIISHSCYEGKQSIYPNNGILPIISYNEPKCESYIITIPEKKLGGEVDTDQNQLSEEYKKYLKDTFTNYNSIEDRFHK